MARFVVAALVSVTALAGCLETPGTPTLREVYGDDAIVEGPDGAASILVPAVEGRFGADAPGTWKEAVRLTLEGELALTKSDPGPLGGGGEERDLKPAAAPLEVRLKDGSRLSDVAAVRWRLERPDGGSSLSDPKLPVQTMTFPIDAPGRHRILAELYDGGGQRMAVTDVAFEALVGLHWVIESEVRPVQMQGVAPVPLPTPTDYDSMSDRFRLAVASGDEGAILSAKTSFRGDWDPTRGTDVDLQLTGPSADAKTCAAGGAAGPSPVPVPIVPDPGQAEEHLEVEGPVDGVWTARVGTVDCAGADAYYYHNFGPVPYTLDLSLTFP